MRHTTKIVRLFAVLMIAALAFRVVGGIAAQDSGKVIVTGRQMGPDDIPTLDPSLMQDVTSVQVASEFFPGLTNLNEETVEVQPGIATSWDVSDDGTVYTFHLMDNVPWVHYNADTGAVEEVMDDSGNVRYVTAQDFAYSIQRTLDPATASPYQYVLMPWILGGTEFGTSDPSADAATRQALIDALGIKVVDDQTLQITLPTASSVATTIFSMWITWAEPPWAVEEYGEFWMEPENAITYGPFALKEWQHGSGGSLTMIKNPFWPTTPNSPMPMVDEVQFVFLDAEPQLANFEAGTLDVSEVPASALDRIMASPDLSADRYVAPGTCTYYYGFNVEEAPFDDARVRFAFSEAIDRQSIVENILKGGQLPAGYFSLPSLVAAPTQADYPGTGVTTNVDDAKALWQSYLDDTGHTAADFTPTLVYNTNATHEAIAQAIQQQWQQAFGVTVQLTSEDFATYLDNRGTFNVFRAGWCFDYPDTHNFLFDALQDNDMHWDNPDFDALIQDAFSASDIQQRRDDYAKAEDILTHTDAAIAPIYFYITQDLTQPYITRTHSLIGREVYEKWDINK